MQRFHIFDSCVNHKNWLYHRVDADVFAQSGGNVKALLLNGTGKIEKALACRRHAVHINLGCVVLSKMVK